MKKRKLRDTRKAPPGGWIINATLNGQQYRIPERGSGNSFIHLKAALRAQAANAGVPMTDTEAADLIHTTICTSPLADCFTLDESDPPKGAVPFQERNLPVGTVQMGTGGGCRACGGGRRR